MASTSRDRTVSFAPKKPSTSTRLPRPAPHAMRSAKPALLKPGIASDVQPEAVPKKIVSHARTTHTPMARKFANLAGNSTAKYATALESALTA